MHLDFNYTIVQQYKLTIYQISSIRQFCIFTFIVEKMQFLARKVASIAWFRLLQRLLSFILKDSSTLLHQLFITLPHYNTQIYYSLFCKKQYVKVV